ncbi:unnamed protein product [Spodoptera exigua]|uniref:Homeobox domain-containing protein n=1 Tax=Spodoptera exigua TaxID=7107 RepID=A0A922M894_SPOEX|nr:hypothetical protein HF086_003542 [Spodoptera exigua]CAH0673931.1 unnamed protein product [Spodoptera exigua]
MNQLNQPQYSYCLPQESVAVPLSATAPNPNYHIWHNGQSTGWPIARPQAPTLANKKPKRVRTAFTTDQLMALENEFKQCRFLARPRRLQLADILRINERTIKIWFQNRRMKQKKDLAESQSSSAESSEDNQSPILQYHVVIPSYPAAGAVAPTSSNVLPEQHQYSPNMYWETQPVIPPGNAPAQQWQPAVQGVPPQEASYPPAASVPPQLTEHHQYSPYMNGETRPIVPLDNIPEQSLQQEVLAPLLLEASHNSAEQPAQDVHNDHNNFSWPQLELGDQLLLPL